MKMFLKNTGLTVLCLTVFLVFGNAQKKADVQVLSAPPTVDSASKACKNLSLGKIISNPKPDYPPEARNNSIGGTVEVDVKVDEKGNVTEIEKVSGNVVLQGAAVKSALQAKFSPTVCDNSAVPISGVITYNFTPYFYTNSYFTPAKIEDFTDITKDSPYYETLIDLLENDKTAFGYADKKFHPEVPLTRGDFAHFLRLTLDMLSERAKQTGKLPREINLFAPHNPQAIASADKIIDLNAKQPFAESVKTLLLKYDIAMRDEQGKFQGYEPLAQNEMMDLWSAIFGADAISVNFEKSANAERLMTRGEFALFLQESLRVLTYKVLP